jgi:phosphorylcholine metabolism protein LicD
MAGVKQSTEKLNNTLKFIITLLINNNITNWFIGYGTLLGIVRNNSCINGDDDIDIIIDKRYTRQLVEIMVKSGFRLQYSRHNLVKTLHTEQFSSIDFYCAEYDNETKNFNDTWEKVIWSNCKLNDNFIKKRWNGLMLNLPFNYKQKLIRRYGEDWNIPKNSKGVFPRLKVL